MTLGGARWWLPPVLGMAAAAAQTDPAAVRAFVRCELPRSEVALGEAVSMRIVVGVDRALLPQLVQLFQRELQLPVQIAAPWFDGTRQLLWRDEAAAPAPTAVSLALNDGVTAAAPEPDEQRDGRAFAVFSLQRRLLPLTEGVVQLAAPRLRLAYATAFRDDFVSGRLPVDRRDLTVDGVAAALTVRPLPTAGRPPGFTGAVGDFAVSATASPVDVAVGERLVLTLRVRGDGDLQRWAPPPLQLEGFHGYGVLDGGVERLDDGAARVLRYELAPTEVAVTAVPPLAFDYFAPGDDGGYRAAHTAPIPLRVRPAAAAPGADGDRPQPPVNGDDVELADIHPASALPRDDTGPGDVAALGLLLSPWVALAALWFCRRPHRRAAAPTPHELAGAFARAAAARDVDLLSALDDYLQARLGGVPADGEALQQLLASHAVAADLSFRTVRLRQSLAAARYGGVSAGVAAAADDVVRALELHFDGRRG